MTTKGRLEQQKELEEEFDKHLRNDIPLSFLTYLISKNQCKKMMTFFNQYNEHTKKSELAGNVYGFGANPLKFQGAGCASYAQAFVEVAQLKHLFNFNQKVYVSKALAGDPKRGRFVSIWKLLFSDENLSRKSAEKIEFSFPDPALMNKFVQDINSKSGALPRNVVKRGIISERSQFAILTTKEQGNK